MTQAQLRALMAWIDARIEEVASKVAMQGYVVIGDTPDKREKVLRSALAKAFGCNENALD